MTETEFDVLDELYFLQSYNYLRTTLNIGDEILKDTLQKLTVKGWVKCYSSPTEELEFDSSTFENNYRNYYYLASKAGLLAHNSIF